MKKYIGVLAIAFFATACSNGIDGVAVPMSKADQAQYDLEHKFQVVGIDDSELQSNCVALKDIAKDNRISSDELVGMGIGVSLSTDYSWPEDQKKILSIIMMSSYYYCPEYYYMLGK